MSHLPPWCFNPLVKGYEPVYGDFFIEDNFVLMYLKHVYTGSMFLAIPKYVFKPGVETPWVFLGEKLARLFETYSSTNVHKALASTGAAVYEPLFGVPVYETNLNRISLVCSSKAANQQVIRRPTTRLQQVYAELLHLLGCKVRPTGSLVLGSEHKGSDLDLVATDINCVFRLQELVEERVVKPYNSPMIERWAVREALSRGLDKYLLAKLYRPWARFMYKDIAVSIAFASDRLRSTPLRSIHVIENYRLKCYVVRVECCQETLGDYPARIEVENPYLSKLVVYDGIYVPALLEGGMFKVCGLPLRLDDERALAVGVAEAHTVIEPL